MWWGGGATNSRSIEIEFLLITSTRAFPTQPTLDAKYVGIKKKKKKKSHWKQVLQGRRVLQVRQGNIAALDHLAVT